MSSNIHYYRESTQSNGVAQFNNSKTAKKNQRSHNYDQEVENVYNNKGFKENEKYEEFDDNLKENINYLEDYLTRLKRLELLRVQKIEMISQLSKIYAFLRF